MLLTLASDKVLWKVVDAIDAATPELYTFYAAHGAPAVVTCAKDGRHSAHSRHYWKPGDARPAQAIDLRIWDLIGQRKPDYAKAAVLGTRLAEVLNHLALSGWYACVLLHRTHFHVEWNRSGQPANIVGQEPGKFFYVDRIVGGA